MFSLAVAVKGGRVGAGPADRNGVSVESMQAFIILLLQKLTPNASSLGTGAVKALSFYCTAQILTSVG